MSLDQSRIRGGSVTLVGVLAYILQSFAFGVLYFFLVRLGLDLVSAYPSATPVWSPAGFALAAVIVGGYRLVPAIFAAAFLAGAPSVDVTYAAASAAGAATEACAGALLINSLANGQKSVAGRHTESDAVGRSCSSSAAVDGIAQRTAQHRHARARPVGIAVVGHDRWQPAVGKQRWRVLDTACRHGRHRHRHAELDVGGR